MGFVTASGEVEVPLTFVIPVRNDASSLIRCLDAIARQSSSTSFQVVVADNGSSDGSADAARSRGARVIELPALRVGALRNQAALLAATPLIAFVDADHEIADGWVAAARARCADPHVGAVGAPYSSPAGATWVQRIYDAFRHHRDVAEDVDWLGAGNLVVRRDAFVATGGFDTSLEACEDVDWCRRLKQAGYRLISDPQLRSVHYGDPASLRALFRSERWRGRNNVQVTLRGPLNATTLPSLLVPIVDLLALGIGVSALIAQHPTLSIGAAAVIVMFAVLRAVRVWQRLARRTAFDLVRAFSVALVYDAARALALVSRAPHRRADPANVVPAQS
jgi:GT2 family glycosyltransferase